MTSMMLRCVFRTQIQNSDIRPARHLVVKLQNCWRISWMRCSQDDIAGRGGYSLEAAYYSRLQFANVCSSRGGYRSGIPWSRLFQGEPNFRQQAVWDGSYSSFSWKDSSWSYRTKLFPSPKGVTCSCLTQVAQCCIVYIFVRRLSLSPTRVSCTLGSSHLPPPVCWRKLILNVPSSLRTLEAFTWVCSYSHHGGVSWSWGAQQVAMQPATFCVRKLFAPPAPEFTADPGSSSSVRTRQFRHQVPAVFWLQSVALEGLAVPSRFLLCACWTRPLQHTRRQSSCRGKVPAICRPLGDENIYLVREGIHADKYSSVACRIYTSLWFRHRNLRSK